MCHKHQAVKRGIRREQQIFFCQACQKYFSRSLTIRKKTSAEHVVTDHLEGLSYRRLAERRGAPKKKLCSLVNDFVDTFQDNYQVTEYFKESLRYSGNHVLDGKYIPVKEVVVERGKPGKIPRSRKRRKVLRGKVLAWGADYDSHDIPHCEFGRSENLALFNAYFARLKKLGYPLKSLTIDDQGDMIVACLKYWPDAVIQLCHRHYLAKVNRLLLVKNILVKIKAREKKLDKVLGQFTDEVLPVGRVYSRSLAVQFANEISELEFTYELLLDFYAALQSILSSTDYQTVLERITSMEIYFLPKRFKMNFSKVQLRLVKKVWLDFKEQEHYLFNHLKFPDLRIPHTTNLMEGYNSQLESRLGSIRGFELSDTAKNYLNAWIIKRRFTKFTDCKIPFKHLNGKTPLECAGADISKITNWMKTFRKKLVKEQE
ncbi:MAG: hypothetical protein HYZ69_00370 [Candidatus Colwellbacteria bacterium]|nr:hypothetical protein [Candidatus Colwellbacteria bacterium]